MELKDITTNQELFNYAVGKMLKQNERSHKGQGCAYRGHDGLKCAIGHVIANEHYNDSCEGDSVDSPGVCEMVTKSLPNLKEELDIVMLNELQGVHDYNVPSEWVEECKNVSNEFELKYEPIEFN